MADLSYEKVDIQKKAFGKWINAQLPSTHPRRVTDLFYDLRDGEVLLDVLAHLTSKYVKREQGNLRVQRLGNVDVALNILRENRVALAGINSTGIVDGDSKTTLDVVWAIILHWQFHKVLQQSSTASLNNLERTLLAWCKQSTVEVKDFTRSLADGMVLCSILHHHKPELFDIETVRAKSPRERLDFVFRMMFQHYGVARILNAEDMHTLTPDKKSVMTYVMCMFQVLPHDIRALEESEAGLEVVETVHLGSPLKTPSNLKSGKLLDYDSFCQLHEDVLEWLLEADDRLRSMQSVSNELLEVKAQFDVNSEYMSELDTHQKAVGEVIRKGRHLLSSNLTSYQEKDVQVRKKLLIDRWEGLRQQALDRQNSLYEKLMALQRSEMQKLRNWMMETEDKISRMTIVGCTLESLRMQEDEYGALEKSLEDQHETVNSISNFIFVETEAKSEDDPNKSIGDASGNRSKSEESGGSGEQDLEGQLMALGERWTVLCTWVEERAEILRITRDELELLEREKERLILWLDQSEGALREMDRHPREHKEELVRQGQLIATIQKEWATERKALMNVDSVAEKLVSRCIASLPNGEDPSVAIAKDTSGIAKAVESIQDRWDILTEILEAQKQRVARQGIDMEKMQPVPHKVDLKDDSYYSGASSGGEENTPKKRKMTGTKRITFETSYAKASVWLQRAQEKLGAEPMEDVTDLEDDLKTWRPKIHKAIKLGEDLMNDIQSEQDYPPDYLNNVSEKVALVRQQMSQLEINVPTHANRFSYQQDKLRLYSKLDALQKILAEYDQWLQSAEATTDSKASKEMVLEITAMKSNIATHNQSVNTIKALANETLLHPGATEDPGNRIKADLYSFCEQWDALDSKLAQMHANLLKSTTVAERRQQETPNIHLKEVPEMEDDLRVLEKCPGAAVESAIQLKELIEKVKKHQDDVEGVSLWMEEVSAFLSAEDALFGDLTNLESQVKDSDSLLEDLKTLQPKLDAINEGGIDLLNKCATDGSAMAAALKNELKAINAKWEETTNLAREQNSRIRSAVNRSQKLIDSLNEIQSFTAQLTKDLPDNVDVKKPADLSQRTFKLLHFKDKIERKRGLFESLLALRDTPDLVSSPIVCKITQAEERWNLVCKPVVESYKTMKMASTEYGEFKTLSAQESDWLERLEKKLRKSANSAADAEEISEELNEIENFLDNHPEGRLERIKELAKSLTEKNILISSWLADAQRLEARWDGLSQRARKRTTLLETSIAEAQEWEYKLIAVQDWLTDRDIVLSSHLEHELTVDDLPDESQAMLREFEDQENLLAEMDEQVDAYRTAGKLEAALRLEDQLHLIHERFQELSMKFELFQQQPTVEYEPRLARVARQLRDIKEKLYLTELASAEKEGIEGQLHHARCIQNALSDIKAEVGNLIKIGRKILETETFERKMELKEKIDSLETDYHDTGSEVILASRKLSEALALSDRLTTLMAGLRDWMREKLAQIETTNSSSNQMVPFLQESVQDMLKEREVYEEIKMITGKFYGLCNPALLTTLKENMTSIDDEWATLYESLAERLSEARKLPNADDGLVDTADVLDELKISETRKLSSMSQDETPLFEEFRSAFQEISQWINKAEAKLSTNRESQERAIGLELDEWGPKIGNLRKMAEKLVQLFVSQRQDVEPEMASIDQRWDQIVSEVEERLASNKEFRMVEVEEIKTTISHISIPMTEPVVTVTEPSPTIDPDEEITTLPEEDLSSTVTKKKSAHFKSSPTSFSSRDSSPESLSGETSFLRKKAAAINIISPKKSPPPKPLPKPKWYVDQRARGVQMPISPEKVKVTTNTLPSPQRLIGTVEASATDEMQMPEKAMVPISTSTTPSSVNSPMSLQQVDDDVLAKENAAIDVLLAETEQQLAEVTRHVRGINAANVKKDKDQRDFENDLRSLMNKIEVASGKLDDLDQEQDLRLRRDLIDMEVKFLEAEVPTLISRGDTLILMTHRKDIEAANNMQEQVTELRLAWHDLQSRTDSKRKATLGQETKLKQFRKDVEQMKRWLSSAKVRLVRASNDQQVAKQFIVEVKNKQSEIDHINNIAAQLQQHNALSGQEMALNIVNSDWEGILRGAKPLMVKDQLNGNHGDEIMPRAKQTPGSPLMKSAPAEVATRIAKMLDALSAIDRQLTTQILGTERPCENLAAQDEALTTAKNALEKLRPTLRQTDQDLDKLSGTLSMEYFEKLSNSSSQLHKEWDRIRHKYAQRQELWNKCKTVDVDYKFHMTNMTSWLRNTEQQITSDEIEGKGKIITELTDCCKEFMSNTSAQEALRIQSEVDAILRQWKAVLASLSHDRKAATDLCEKVDSMSLLLNRVVNSTDKKALVRAISRLSEIHGGIADLRHQLCERISEGPTKDSSFLRARTTMERLAITIPRRIEVLREKDKRLDSFMGKRDKALVSMQSIKSDLDEAKRRPDFQQRLTAIKKIHLSVVNMQYEVNRVLNEHAVLEQEVASSQFDVDPELSCKMHTFKDSWTKLSSEIRHLTAGGSIVSEASESGVELSATESGQQASVVQSPSSHTSGESCVSRTTYSQSSFHSEEAHLDVDDIACKVERELQQMLEEATASNLPVDDPATIRGVVERQQQVMRRLESKRDYLDSLVSTSRSRGGESVSASTDVLQSRVGVLRDQLDVTKHRVLSRKSECTAMASDSEQFARKLNEIDSWLDRLEGILQSTYPVGQTLDVLEHQHQCTMDALKELSKYDHHIKLFMQVCERMVTVYSRDHTQQVVSSRTKVHDQHINLVAEFTKRRNEIQAVQNSFASYDRSIERFFDWLFDIESSVEQLESEASGSPDRQRALRQRFDNIKHEIHDKDRVFNALAKTGNGLLGKMAQEEKMMLSQKLSEMNSRWKALQNKMLGINMAIQSSAQKAATTATDDEQHVPISVQHASLRDHTDWVLRKKRELASLSLDGDVKGLRRQFEEHTSFRHHLTEKSIIIRSGLVSGHQLLKDHRDKADFGNCLVTLEREWNELVERSDEWHDDVIRMLDNVKGFEDRLMELDKGLLDLESEVNHMDNGLDALDDHKSDTTAIDRQFDRVEVLHDDLENRANHILQLSQSNRRQLEELTRRVSHVQSGLAENRMHMLDPTNDQDFLSSALSDGWERGEAEEGIPYYINHSDEQTQWDHPEFTKLMETLLEMNTVKFSVYRMALKLRKVQQKLCLDLLDLKSALFGFDEHGLTPDRHDNSIKVPQMVVVLTSIFETLHQEEPEEVDVALCVDLCLNWLLNVYDSARTTGQIRVFSFKLGILVLCRGPLTEKYIQLFNLTSTDGKVVPRQLGLLLFDAIQIPKVLAEVAAFGGSNVEPSVRSCFAAASSSKEPADSVTCPQFLKWLQKEPQSMVWLPVLHRLSAAEMATHESKCKACKAYPIVGFRYHCLKCFNFDLCHNCFFVGQTAKGHKAEHPMQEYCTSTGRSANMKILGQAIRNSFRSKKYFKKKQGKLGYLPVGSLTDGHEFSPTISPNMSMNSRSQLTANHSPRILGDGSANNVSSDVTPIDMARKQRPDEHHLIAEYCQYLHEKRDDCDGSAVVDLATNIRDLESERKALMAEYRDLTKQAAIVSDDNDEINATNQEVEDQTKQLRQQTSRMETRMQMLVDHNSQLELQLQRLRHLAPGAGSGGGQFGTLQSKSVVAQDLNVQSPSRNDEANTDLTLETRRPPPLHSSRDLLMNGAINDEERLSSVAGSVGSQSSLDLSAHETQAHDSD